MSRSSATESVALTGLLACALTASASAQFSHGGEPAGLRSPMVDPVPIVHVPAPDVGACLAEDAAREHRPLRYGSLIEVDLTLANGVWTELADGSRVWRMRVASEGAHSLALEFETFALPTGAEMFVYHDELDFVFGAYTQQNEHLGGGFVFEPYPGSELTLEVNVPEGAEDPVIRVSSVIYDYRDVYGLMEGTVTVGSSGAEAGGNCQIDVNCPLGDPWGDQKRATMFTISAGSLCSAALINNTDGDQTNYVLTANHCNQGANTVFRFGFEKPGCDSGTAPTNMSVSGATVLASNSNFDGRFLRINADIPASFEPYYAGWTRTQSDATLAFAMGHPSAGPKRIALDDDGTTLEAKFWRVSWQPGNGIISGGASGGPLFDQNGLIRGPACCVSNLDCGNQDAFYGRFDRFYTVANLAQWLDPSGTGVLTVSGLDPLVSDPEIYCTGKVSGAGFAPLMSWSNAPSFTANDFAIEVNTALPLRPMLFFGGSGRASIPFFNATLCTNPPLRRGPVISTDDFGFASQVEPFTALEVGTTFNKQAWISDPNVADGTGVALSDALEYTVEP